MNDEKTIDMSCQKMLTDLAKLMVDKVEPNKWETVLEETRKMCIGKPGDEMDSTLEWVVRFMRQEVKRIHLQRLN